LFALSDHPGLPLQGRFRPAVVQSILEGHLQEGDFLATLSAAGCGRWC
jgi:hypothetical protein